MLGKLAPLLALIVISCASAAAGEAHRGVEPSR